MWLCWILLPDMFPIDCAEKCVVFDFWDTSRKSIGRFLTKSTIRQWNTRQLHWFWLVNYLQHTSIHIMLFSNVYKRTFRSDLVPFERWASPAGRWAFHASSSLCGKFLADFPSRKVGSLQLIEEQTKISYTNSRQSKQWLTGINHEIYVERSIVLPISISYMMTPSDHQSQLLV